MKIWTLAVNTLQGLLRSRVVLVLFFVYVAVLLLSLSPMLFIRHSATASNGPDLSGFFLSELQGLVVMTSSVGSLFAMLGGAYAVSSEIRSGTILAVMARPVARWEMLVGSYLGVQGLLVLYIALMLGFEEVLSLVAHQRIATSWWVLLAYPLVRYLLYSAIGSFFSVFAGPIVAVGATFLTSILARLLEAGGGVLSHLPSWILTPVRYALPSVGLLGEEKYLSVTSSPLHAPRLTQHLTALGHGLDYACIMLLLAAWIFRRRPLVRA
jgi:ABC-type transport system involved in multi-copper enzyme maturation permease subunit